MDKSAASCDEPELLLLKDFTLHSRQPDLMRQVIATHCPRAQPGPGSSGTGHQQCVAGIHYLAYYDSTMIGFNSQATDRLSYAI